jgi:uncharacterized protein YkwD
MRESTKRLLRVHGLLAQGDNEREGDHEDDDDEKNKKKKPDDETAKDDDPEKDDDEDETEEKKESRRVARRMVAAAAKARNEDPPQFERIGRRSAKAPAPYVGSSDKQASALAMINAGRKARGLPLLTELPEGTY